MKLENENVVQKIINWIVFFYYLKQNIPWPKFIKLKQKGKPWNAATIKLHIWCLIWY